MSMRRRPLVALAALVLVATAAAGCGSTNPTLDAGSAVPATTAPPPPTDAPTGPPLTPVPGGQSEEPEPPPFNPGTTETSWGTILDSVPDDFPVYPGALPAEVREGPISGAMSTPDAVDTVATWYRERLEAEGYTIDNLSDPLEDGSRVLDIVTDLPECRIQVTFRPAGGATLIVILYGAGCRFTGEG